MRSRKNRPDRTRTRVSTFVSRLRDLRVTTYFREPAVRTRAAGSKVRCRGTAEKMAEEDGGEEGERRRRRWTPLRGYDELSSSVITTLRLNNGMSRWNTHRKCLYFIFIFFSPALRCSRSHVKRDEITVESHQGIFRTTAYQPPFYVLTAIINRKNVTRRSMRFVIISVAHNSRS